MVILSNFCWRFGCKSPVWITQAIQDSRFPVPGIHRHSVIAIHHFELWITPNQSHDMQTWMLFQVNWNFWLCLVSCDRSGWTPQSVCLLWWLSQLSSTFWSLTRVDFDLFLPNLCNNLESRHCGENARVQRQTSKSFWWVTRISIVRVMVWLRYLALLTCFSWYYLCVWSSDVSMRCAHGERWPVSTGSGVSHIRPPNQGIIRYGVVFAISRAAVMLFMILFVCMIIWCQYEVCAWRVVTGQHGLRSQSYVRTDIASRVLTKP